MYNVLVYYPGSRGPFLLENPTILVVDLLYSILKKADARGQSVLTKP